MAKKVAVVLQSQIISVLKACRRTRIQVGGGDFYSQLTTTMPLTTVAGGGGGGDPPRPTPTTPTPPSKPVSVSRSGKSPSAKDKQRLHIGEGVEKLMALDKIYVQTCEDATAVQHFKCSHGWPGTHVVMHTDTNPGEVSKIKKAAREVGIEPKKASHWEE